MILDASALLALLQDEPGAAVVSEHLSKAAITAVNLEEVVGVLVREGMPARDVEAILEPLSIPVLPFTAAMAWRAGRIRAQLPSGLGIADRCCLAAGAVTARMVVTADRGWTSAAKVFGVDLLVVR